MNVRELKEFLEDLDDEMEVCTRETQWNREDFVIYLRSVYNEGNGDTEEVVVMQ